MSSTLIPCPGTIRDVHLFKLEYYRTDANGDPIYLWCVVMHTKAGDGVVEAADRALMTEQVMDYLAANKAGSDNILIMGDFNLYTSAEVAYQNLLTYSDADVVFNDPIDMPGVWSDNSSFSSIHTQATRYDKDGDGLCYTGVDCGAECGSDDRFDFILATNSIIDGTNKVVYKPGTYKVVGQDGLHMDAAIIDAPVNASCDDAVLPLTGADVINALYEMSDHYPVTLKLDFQVGSATSEASAPATQVTAGSISSLLDSPAEATDVFKFDIDDLGADDNLVTKVTNIRIKPAASNTADWTNHIQGIKLNAGAIIIGTPVITDTYIDIPIAPIDLNIADGGSTLITMSIYLNTTNIVDGAILSFMIDADNHGFTSLQDATSSVFNNVFTGGDVTSNNFTIAVIATQISFVQQPTSVSVNSAMSPSVTVAGTDANGNVDTGYATAITITSNGTLTGTPVTGVLASGVATFASLTHTVAELTRTLSATSGALNATSSTFDIANCMTTDNFEDGNLTGWGNTANWANSTTTPISGTRSLKHNGAAVDGTDYINYVLSCGSSCGNMAWQFNMKNGAWDPSSTSKFWFYLSANETTLNSLTIDGYAVGVDLAGYTDMVTLWKVTNGVATTLIESSVDWGISTLAGIKVTRDVYGSWTLYVDGNGNFDNLVSYGTVTNTDYAIDANVGLVYTFIASRTGQLWLDDFTWTCYPIVVAPEMRIEGNATVISDEDASPSTADNTDFGTIATSGGTVDKTFTIYNTGTSALAISGTPKVVVTGSADFTVTVDPTTPVAVGGSTTFTVHFDPSSDGLKSATLSIANDDADENPYNFSIQGTGTSFALSAGDIAFVEYNADGTDVFAFVVLEDLVASEVIYFTDDGWRSTNVWRGSEGIITWTAPATPVTCGTIIRITPTVDAPTANIGTCATTLTDVSITDAGDQIIAYTESASPYNIIAAVQLSAAWDADATSTATSALPLGLTTGTNCITVGTPDNGKYNNSILLTGSKANLLSAINNSANWTQDNAVNQTFVGTFNVLECLPPQPEINILGNATSIIDEDITPSIFDDTDFGEVNISGGTLAKTFTIQNTGLGSLTISGLTPFVTIGGLNAADFSVTVIPNTTIAAAGTTTFEITFNPSNFGSRAATITITSNDLDEATYNFTIQGSGIFVLPEINITGNSVNILDGDVTPSVLDFTDFGSADINTGTVDKTFTIENIGNANLLLTDASPFITISGTNAADFSVSIIPPSTIVPSDFVTFTITFDPNDLGDRYATISITNDDADENPYNFSIIGRGTDLEPEMVVKGNANTILDGDITPETTDFTDFGNVNVTATTLDKVFTIENIGVANLILSGAPVSISGTNAADFSVQVQATSPVAVGGSTTFTIRFDPSAGGLRTATISIENDDSDENPYTFDIQGTGVKDEPTNHPTVFACGVTEAISIPISWTDASIGTAPDGYLIKWNTTGTFSDPVDGTPVVDAAGVVNIAQGVQATTAFSLIDNTTYYFKIWPYTNSGLNINYKTDGTVPTTNCATIDGQESIAYQGFEVDPAVPADTWIYSGTITESTDRFYVGAKSGRLDLANSIILQNVDISLYENVKLSVAFSGSGPDSGEDLYLDISYDNGTTWTGTGSVKLVDGFSGTNIAFGATNLVDPTTVGSNPWIINIDNVENQISVRFRVLALLEASEYYYIDDVKLTGVPVPAKPEPSNNPTNLSCGTTTQNSILVNWTAAVAGTQAPEYYLLQWNTTGVFSDPVDGTPIADDVNGVENITYGTNSFNVTGLTLGTDYYFKIWSYTNTGTNVDYKITSVATSNCSTLPLACLSEDFLSSALPTDWIQTGVTFPAKADFGAFTGSLTTLAIDNPILLNFNLIRTVNTDLKTMYVEVSTSTQDGTYQTIATYDLNNTIVGTTACSVDLSAYENYTVYLRFRKSSATTSSWGVDDIIVYCGSCSPPTTNSSTLTFSNKTNTSVDVTIGTKGDGAKAERGRDCRRAGRQNGRGLR